MVHVLYVKFLYIHANNRLCCQQVLSLYSLYRHPQTHLSSLYSNAIINSYYFYIKAVNDKKHKNMHNSVQILSKLKQFLITLCSLVFSITKLFSPVI